MRPFFLAVVMLLRRHGNGRPSAKADPALAPWFRSLVRGYQHSCARCQTAAPPLPDRRRSLRGIDRRSWFAVPADKILQRTGNPTGRPSCAGPRSAGSLLRAGNRS